VAQSIAHGGRNRCDDARAGGGELVAATSLLPLLVARARETRPADAPEWISIGDAAEFSGMSRFFFL